MRGLCLIPKAGESDGFTEWYKAYQDRTRSGYTAINKKDYIAGIDHYTRAIEISPFIASHYYYRGLAWYKKGNEEKAIEDFNKVIILDARWTAAYVYRGLCRMNREEYQQALSDYKTAFSLNAEDATAHNNLAWLYATAKDEKFRDREKALEHARKAAELTKENNAEILDTLARAYFINDKKKEALEAEEKALKLDPDNEELKKKLEAFKQSVANLGSAEISLGEEVDK